MLTNTKLGFPKSVELGSNGWPINLQIPPGQKQRWQICWSAGSSRTWSPPPPPRTTQTSFHWIFSNMCLSSTRGVHNYHHQNRADYQGLMFLDLGSIDQIPNMDNLDNIQCTSLPMCHLIMAEYFQYKQLSSIRVFKNRFFKFFFLLVFSLFLNLLYCVLVFWGGYQQFRGFSGTITFSLTAALVSLEIPLNCSASSASLEPPPLLWSLQPQLGTGGTGRGL